MLRKEIIKVVADFIRGGDQSDLGKLDRVLHRDFRNVQYGFFEKKGVVILDKKKYIALVADKVFGGISRNMEIVSLDVHDTVSVVQLRLESTKMIFNSFVSLIKEHDKWKVIGQLPDIYYKTDGQS
ncbi:nuclear transport factor 2 family protein [Spongiimicrobium sp. 2-473A-2-J]|uniref:nuclear transport factor 2 family protein n=1 Tax=Eudoraea algarum TaxID=3417568 RepID=UPI003D35C2C5